MRKNLLQNYRVKVRTICGVLVHGELVEKDMSEKLGKFDAFQLVYFANITLLEISGMTYINAQHFLETVIGCVNLKEIRLSGCVQFHEMQIVKILCSLHKLEIVDATATKQLQYVSVYNIVTTLKNLRNISVEPKWPESKKSRGEWEWLVRNFRRIVFGHSIMRIFPHCGSYLRL